VEASATTTRKNKGVQGLSADAVKLASVQDAIHLQKRPYMFNFVSKWKLRRQHKKDAWRCLDKLLGPVESLKPTILAAYPGIRHELRQSWQEDELPEEVAIRIFGVIILRIIEDCVTPPQRERILSHWDGSMPYDPLTTAPLLVQLIDEAASLSAQWVAAGRLADETRAIFEDELVGALHGEGRNTRWSDRARKYARAMVEVSPQANSSGMLDTSTRDRRQSR